MIEHTIFLNNKKVRYLEAGDGPPVFLLHSWPYSADIFYKNIEILAKRHRVVAPDFPGFGFSETGDPSSSLDSMAEFVIKLANHLKFTKFSVVGISMGGTIALLVAAKSPQNISRVVVHSPIFEPNWFWNNPKLRSIKPYAWLLGFRFGKSLLSWYMKSRIHFWIKLVHMDSQIKRKDSVVIEKIYATAQKSSSTIVVNIFSELVSTDFRAKFRKISCPVLVIQGENDLLPKQAMEYFCNKVLRNAKMKIVKQGTHDLVVERFNDFNQVVSNFL